MAVFSISNIRKLVGHIDGVSVRNSIERGCLDVRAKEEKMAVQACEEIKKAGFYAEVLGYYNNLGFWLIGAAKDKATAGR